uniref:Venom protein family 8 protein 1 n=1 Tax=Pristhesancus plagipennis TaxID=1955184 RepID=A0A1Q1NPD7_PRIPG|nr:venom protein family 8 protein 1 [Pristhesancus plagipennis]
MNPLVFLLPFVLQVVFSTNVSVSSHNGEAVISINNQVVDLNKANLVERTPYSSVYNPAEDRSCLIIQSEHALFVKCNGSTSSSSSGSMGSGERQDFNNLKKKYAGN